MKRRIKRRIRPIRKRRLKRLKRKGHARRSRPVIQDNAGPPQGNEFNQAFDQAYNEGFNAGFAKGFEDGHHIAYASQ
ncbi:hypothetical protein [Paenibacillus sp. CECT 9249]|uniref:hypothetical protein n=1 Tax=Paenibacillus sp. CECT 9249 TaxID=2845385 RepID=UPI001E5A17BE|nr:hypothetical protein [Paenibacillus sp. CECT 9249]